MSSEDPPTAELGSPEREQPSSAAAAGHEQQARARRVAALRRFSKATGIAAIPMGLVVLAAWFFEVELLKRAFPAMPAMKANTAVGFVLLGTAVWMCHVQAKRWRAHWIGVGCAGVVFLLAVATASQWATGADLGIDQLLFREVATDASEFDPGRMSAVSALAFVLLSSALLLLHGWKVPPTWRLPELLAAASILVTTAGILDLALTPAHSETNVGLHTVLGLLVLGCGVLFVDPDRGLPLLVGETNGGAVARRLLPVAVVVPLLIAWLSWAGAQLGLYGMWFDVSLSAMTKSVILVAVIVWTATSIDRADVKRRNAEQALRRQETMLRAVLDALPAGVWIADSAGHAIGANDAARELWAGGPKVTRERYSEYKAWWADSGEPLKGDDWAMARAINSGETSRGEVLEIECFDGERKTILHNGAPIRDADGKIIGAVAAAMDITDRKRAEDALKERSEDLARSNSDLEQFAYVASHDLQEPLRAVAGCVQILQQRLGRRLDGQDLELMSHATAGAARMQSLINDLLAFSRVGTRAHNLQPIASEDAFQRAVAGLSSAIAESGVSITHDPLPHVAADPMQLAQLLQNLIANAIKFRRDEAPRVHVGARLEGDAWHFTVSDNGIGIEADYFDRIFVVFQRLHTRREYPGTGIGLAICKKIVERHGGRIWLESQPGVGSTFHFNLPATT